MKKLIGYGKTLWFYFKTPKGRHDTIDYLRAIGIMAAVIALVMWVVKLFSEK